MQCVPKGSRQGNTRFTLCVHHLHHLYHLHHVLLSSNLHMPNQVLINPMVSVVHETFLGLLQLV